ncbi:hypothetical protein HK103_006480 [Boothiomyces macroporosus]|uniref:Uncharacterized protein n=1 Tax=Boothiomyces macroporosus TaxID=261099 RepID=A0AAD5UPT7_9FUNG|nr:hypothetical protein HK103_006480 [Boothiomyces macroporosus]
MKPTDSSLKAGYSIGLKLDETNWTLWKFRMLSMLKAEDLWDASKLTVVNDPSAKEAILLNLSDKFTALVNELPAPQIWSYLVDYFKEGTPTLNAATTPAPLATTPSTIPAPPATTAATAPVSSPTTTQQETQKPKLNIPVCINAVSNLATFKAGSSMKASLNEFSAIVNTIKSVAGPTISVDDFAALYLLASLPKEYAPIKKNVSELDFELISQLVLQQEKQIPSVVKEEESFTVHRSAQRALSPTGNRTTLPRTQVKQTPKRTLTRQSTSPGASPKANLSLVSKHQTATLYQVFQSFCQFGSGKVDPNAMLMMDGTKFAKVCKDCGIVSKSLSIIDVDIVFNRVKPKTARKIDKKQFIEGLLLLAEIKYEEYGDEAFEQLYQDIVEAGTIPKLDPNVSFTVNTEIIQRLTDHTLYTGILI